MRQKKLIHGVKFRMLVVIILICCAVILLLLFLPAEERKPFQVIADDSITEYLVDTPGCRIPSLDPWDPSVRPFYKYSGIYKCQGRPSFLRVKPNGVVSVDNTYLQLYYEQSADKLSCRYQAIDRAGSVDDFTIDTNFVLGPEKNLTFDIPLNEDFVKTLCTLNINGLEQEFIEYLPLTPLKPAVESRCKKAQANRKNRKKLPNVLFLGIDSISRLNFIRHFPKTRDYLNEHMSPFSLKGYNKVGDNTFPNIMPLLTGHFYQYYWNETANRTMYFDDVELLWKHFSQMGYRTLLAEDAPEIATFNYFRSGFKNPPTDYYFRPFALATEHAKERYKQCLGSKMEMTILYDYLKNFLHTMNNTRPFFAFVFLARLTHDVFNFAGYADEPTFQLLRYLHEANFLNDTIMVFYSDHGIRFSSVRNTYTGQFEERTPFIHLLFPKWFLQKYTKIAKNLKTNEKRLTTPFDIHATMLDLLNLDKRKFLEESVLSSPGISLFNEVSPHRTCEHALITSHFCTCKIQEPVPTDDTTVVKAALTVIKTINAWTQRIRDKCSVLVLQKIHYARSAKPPSDVLNSTTASGSKFLEYLIVLSALPSSALFEATVRCELGNSACSVVDDISRINRYGTQSICIKDTVLKKFCYCV